MSWNDFETDVKAEQKQGGPKCTVCTLLERIGPEAAAQVGAALRNPDLTNSGIRRALGRRLDNDAYHIPTPWSLARHRRGECAGGKK